MQMQIANTWKTTTATKNFNVYYTQINNNLYEWIMSSQTFAPDGFKQIEITNFT